MTPYLHQRPRPRGGFTLVELLVAVGLTSIMLWGILQIFTSATRFSSTVTSQAELCASARAVLDRLVREVQSAAPLETGYLKIVDGTDSIQFVGPITYTNTDGDRVTELGHIKFSVNGTTGMIERTIKEADDTTDPLDDAETTVDDTPATFGLEIDAFNVRYIPSIGATVKGKEQIGQSITFETDAVDEDHRALPMALVFELRCSDARGRATITLTSSAPLLASGL